MTATERLLACQFPACAEQMGGVRQKLREALARHCQSEAAINNIVLAVGEACMNIIQHAYGPKDQGDIVLEVELEGDPGTMPRSQCNLVFRLTDFARHKTCAGEMRSRPLDEIRPGGLGCHIINQVMDEVTLLDAPGDCRNVLQMRKHLAG
jgi:sigma-B regulation protein RsbU (phosphoserine phosphatase)